ncbi:hypothetical protein HMPREF1978_01072 [Actinomyces graevenitzii F0530]|uniref:Uncharacterized protein n=1 Tax=Actinomyces graevenitzii F0530 TaxID=1321817 RepID=U1R9I1_9ACTO|nr:hypothetical protein HMPREF1978_01072 [Actinomyces graevenitzii F0530]
MVNQKFNLDQLKSVYSNITSETPSLAENSITVLLQFTEKFLGICQAFHEHYLYLSGVDLCGCRN